MPRYIATMYRFREALASPASPSNQTFVAGSQFIRTGNLLFVATYDSIVAIQEYNGAMYRHTERVAAMIVTSHEKNVTNFPFATTTERCIAKLDQRTQDIDSRVAPREWRDAPMYRYIVTMPRFVASSFRYIAPMDREMSRDRGASQQ